MHAFFFFFRFFIASYYIIDSINCPFLGLFGFFQLTLIKLDITDYQKCSNIWDMQCQSELADKFYNELLTGNRTTYIYTIDNEFVGEISLVKEMNDSDYTIPNQRIYVSRLIVKYEYRRQGIGRKLIDFITEKAKSQDYTEMSIGVDLDNS